MRKVKEVFIKKDAISEGDSIAFLCLVHILLPYFIVLLHTYS